MIHCVDCNKTVAVGCFKANCPVLKASASAEVTGWQKVKKLIDNGTICWDDIIEFIREHPVINQQYELIDHWEE